MLSDEDEGSGPLLLRTLAVGAMVGAAMRGSLLAIVVALLGCSDGNNSGASSKITLEYIAHASFRITDAGGTTLLLDPYASRVWLGYDFPSSFLDADGVAITHPHYDHDYGEFLGTTPPWTNEQIVFREPADSGELGEMTLVGIVGQHAGPYGVEFEQRNTIWVIEHGGLRIAHWGDNVAATAVTVAALGDIDVLLLPIDGLEHLLTTAEVQATMAAVDAKIVVPMHYRHPELEESEDSPEDLGPIDPFLQGRDDVLQPGTHAMELSVETLPERQTLTVLAPSPTVAAARAGWPRRETLTTSNHSQANDSDR